MKITKKIISVILAVMLVFGSVAVAANAEMLTSKEGTQLTYTAVVKGKTANADGKIEAYTLKHTPVSAPVAIYERNGDSTLGAKYTNGETVASETEFAYVDGVISLPTNIEAGAEMFVMYEYKSDNAIEVVNAANQFAKMGKMTFECLVYDVCDPETKIFAYLILPRFQLSNDFDWAIGGDSQTHGFSGKAHVDYCSKDKKMLRIVIVDDEE